MKLTGFLPEFKTCGDCGTPLGESFRGQRYISHEGVLWCQDCRKGGAQTLGAEAYRLLSSTRREGPAHWSASFEGAPEESRRVVSETARRLVRRALEREPRAGKASAPNIQRA